MQNPTVSHAMSSFERLLAVIGWLFPLVALVVVVLPGAPSAVRRHARATWIWFGLGVVLYVLMRFGAGMIGIYALDDLSEPLLGPVSSIAGAIYGLGVLVNTVVAALGRKPVIG